MHLSLLDAYVSLLGFPSGLRKATDGRSRWLLLLCVTLMLFALWLGANGVFLTFVRVTHDRGASFVAAVLAWFVLRSMTRLVVSGTLIPLHYPAPGLAPSDEPAALWLALYGRIPHSTLDYRPPVAPTLLLSSITALAAHPVADLLAARLFSGGHARHGAVLANALLVAVVFGCFAVRHALYALLYPYLVVIWRGEVDVIKRHLAYRELLIARLHSAHADAVIGPPERLSFDTVAESLRRAMKQRVERQKLGAKASLADGSRWTDLFEHWTELRYLFVAPELLAPSNPPPTAVIIDDNGRARVVLR